MGRSLGQRFGPATRYQDRPPRHAQRPEEDRLRRTELGPAYELCEIARHQEREIRSVRDPLEIVGEIQAFPGACAIIASMAQMPASIRARAALLAEWTVIFGARKPRVKTASSIHWMT